MPLYDYRCRACGARFEARVPHDQAPICPECGDGSAEKLLSPFAGPFTVAPRGLAARRSDAERQAREEHRRERQRQRADRDHPSER